MNGRSRCRRAILVPAVLVSALALTLVLPRIGSADTADGLLQGADTLAEREQAALLRLFAAETAAVRARADVDRLDVERRRLAAVIERTRRYREIARQSLASSQARVAQALRTMYVDGPPANAFAVILGASSFDDAIDAVESLRFAFEQNRRLTQEAAAREARLRAATARLERASVRLRISRDAAAAAADRLYLVAVDRSRVLSAIRREAGLTTARLERLQAAARQAERRSSRVVAAAEPATPLAEAVGDEAASVEGSPTSGVQRAPAGGTLTVEAVAYHLPGRTASGLPVGPGIMAVDPRLIPLGTRVFVPGYGEAVAADTGSAVKGNMIDLWMPSLADARAWGSRTVTITIYRS